MTAWSTGLLADTVPAPGAYALDAAPDAHGPEIELEFDEGPVGGMLPPDLVGVHHGHEGYVRVWKAGLEAADDYRMEPAEAIDLGDRLLVTGRQRGRGTRSGVPFDEPLLSLFTLRRALVVRLKDFAARDKALQAAGLRE